MALTSTTVETVEEAPKNGGRLCPQGEPSCLSHPHSSAISLGFQYQEVVLAQVPIKLLHLPGVLEHVRFCVHSFKSEISISNTPVGLLRLNSIGLQSRMP